MWIPGWSFSVTTRKSMSADVTGCANDQKQANHIDENFNPKLKWFIVIDARR